MRLCAKTVLHLFLWPFLVALLSCIRRLLRVCVKFVLICTILLILFGIFYVQFYSYSGLTRIIYSLDWLLAKTPLFATTGEVYIPPAVSLFFNSLHSGKILLFGFINLVYNDGHQYFHGKYHWSRNELDLCNVREDTYFKNQQKDPRFQCHVYRIFLHFVKTEVMSIEPAAVKFHDFLPQVFVTKFIETTERTQLGPSRIMVRDGLGGNIWQDSIVANMGVVNPFVSSHLTMAFNLIRQRIRAINFWRSEPLNVKKYEVGGHYAPHLDFLISNPQPELGNRFATFMFILKAAEEGGGTVFPEAGFTFIPKAGDGILWLNMKPDNAVALESLHGACPIVKGTKIAVTMWIRSIGQELFLPSPLEKEKQHYDYKLLAYPKIL